MTMGKIKKSTLIGMLFAAIVGVSVCWGVSYFIDHINGNTKAQTLRLVKSQSGSMMILMTSSDYRQ